jgi:hypothetical protein
MDKTRILVVAVVFLAAVVAAEAEATVPWGLRIGYTGDDAFKQLFAGGYAEVAQPLPNTGLQPSLEFGFGDDVFVLAANLDLFYKFTELAKEPWSFYGGGGVALNLFDPDPGSSSTEFGLNLAGGVGYTISERNRLVAEVRVGLEDSPDFKISLGLTFF